MPDVPVTLTPWFDAKDNPPYQGKYVWTDLGEATRFGGAWMVSGVEDGSEPTVWCDPSPPDMHAPLTVKDLARLHRLAHIGAGEVWKPTEAPEHRRHYDEDITLVARLRRALDAIGNT